MAAPEYIRGVNAASLAEVPRLDGSEEGCRPATPALRLTCAGAAGCWHAWKRKDQMKAGLKRQSAAHHQSNGEPARR